MKSSVVYTVVMLKPGSSSALGNSAKRAGCFASISAAFSMPPTTRRFLALLLVGAGAGAGATAIAASAVTDPGDAAIAGPR